MSELYHHGIPGQKWGVQNGPPYPLDAKTSAVVKRQARLEKDYFKKRNRKVAGVVGGVVGSSILNGLVASGTIVGYNNVVSALIVSSILSTAAAGLAASKIVTNAKIQNGKRYINEFLDKNKNISMDDIEKLKKETLKNDEKYKEEADKLYKEYTNNGRRYPKAGYYQAVYELAEKYK